MRLTRLRRLIGTTLLLAAPACGGTQTPPPDSPTEGSETDAPQVVAEAASRPVPLRQTFDAEQHAIYVTIDAPSGGFEGTITTFGNVIEQTDVLLIHAAPELAITSTQLLADPDNEPLTFERDGDVVTLRSDRPFEAGERIILEVGFAGYASTSEHLGFYSVESQTSDLPMFFTQFEAQGARRMLPIYDEPFDKATTTVVITADERYRTLSNGVRTTSESDGEGHITRSWENYDPISPYLITIVAAELDSVEEFYTRGDGTTVPLTIYTEPGRTDEAGYAMQSLLDAMAYYEQTWGFVYPWSTYGIVTCPGFQWGGMENKGLTTIGDSGVYFGPDSPAADRYGIYDVVAHELGHEWFGNLVTMKWWTDVWLNEGFASWIADEAMADEFGALGNDLWTYVGLREWYMELESGPFAHPLVPESFLSPDELFDGISYTKGSQIVRMLVELLGRERFGEAIRAHFEQFGLQNADSADFFATMQRFTDIDLAPFIDSWVRGTGFPDVIATVEYNEPTATVRVMLEQLDSSANPSNFVFPYAVGVQGDGYSATTQFVFDQPTEVLEFPATSEPSFVSLNRGRHALARSMVRDATPSYLARQAAEDTDLANRGAAFYELLRMITRPIEGAIEAPPAEGWPTPLLDALDAMLNSDVVQLRGFALDTISSERLSTEVRRSLCLVAAERARAIASEPADGLDAINARNAAIGVLGYAGDEASFALLHDLALGDDPDFALNALVALMEADAPGSDETWSEVLAGADGDRRRVRRLLSIRASTASVSDLDQLEQLLADPAIVPESDNRVVRGVVASLIWRNPDLAWSVEGVAFLHPQILSQADRPVVLNGILRDFERTTERSAEERERVLGLLATLQSELSGREGLELPLATIGELITLLSDSLD